MAASLKGDRSSRNVSSSALSGRRIDNESPDMRSPTAEFQDSKFTLLPNVSPYDDFSEDDRKQSSRGTPTDEKSQSKSKPATMEVIQKEKITGSRKRWVFMVWLLTWWYPTFLIGWITRSKRKDIRQAWREKLAINMLIWLSCAAVMFFMIGMPALICPQQDVFSYQELSAFNGKGNTKAYVSMRGIVYDLKDFVPHHYPSIVPSTALLKYAGLDATSLFPVQVSALCTGVDGSIDPAVQLSYASSNYSATNAALDGIDANAQYHDFRWFRNDSRPDWWFEQQLTMKANYMKGRIGYTPKYLATLASKKNSILSINGRVYDMTTYIAGGRIVQYPWWSESPSQLPNTNFMHQIVVQLFQQSAGTDASKYWEVLPISSDMKNAMKVCLDNLFYVGEVDTRNSTQCLFAKYILLAISILMVTVICFKFLAALQFGKKNVPENLDKFVICQIPAYTEDEESLRRAIDSAARMKYDDKRKLLMIICDGMITGEGNDRPTPRIVLDILGVGENVEPDPLSFESLGEGQKQHNMGKIYSGLYEVQGHIVPFLVVVKVGKPSETARPGNRGKRDSQMILMRFLNRIHYNLPMTPMELEMYHQIRNIIGVNPTFYEYCLQIDADTVVAPDSATRMISAFTQDTRLIGVCGETALTNAKASMVTMIQVYEYYISHNLTKAFESLFGSVTCLPGCFSMYRIRAAETGKPLFVSKEIVEGYSTNRVDTLHLKNLLHLGEDRYLTTLLLKHHSKYKTKYIFRAHAWTIAPDQWSVFLSQRRRWINSTVHNLIELMPLQQLCGFCCFSMRFIVFIDLLSTIVQPVLLGYIIYLIYLVSTSSSVIPMTAFILLGAIYGLQAVIFIIRRKWEMVGWMIVYVISTPIFSFALPLYSFWHMDEFSWGNTRVVTGEKGQKLIISDEGKFDPNSIPRRRWEEYQTELWEMHSQYQQDAMSAAGTNAWRDDRSEHSGISYTRSHNGFGAGTSQSRSDIGLSAYSRPVSQVDLTRGGLPRSDMGHSAYSRPASQLDLTRGAASRVSLAPTAYGALTGEDPSSLGVQQIDLRQFDSGTPLPGVYPAAGPEQVTDDMLLSEIREILAVADLMRVSKKSVRQELERRFGVDLSARKDFIGNATEAVLNGSI